jgi:hypothetical protein
VSDSKEKLRKQVEENVNRSGYSVELYVHSVLNFSNKYMVYPQDYYLDSDENKPRPLDLVVRSYEELSMTNQNEIKHTPLVLTLPIECKKSENNAWVFFMIRDWTNVSGAGQFIDYQHLLTRDFHSKDSILWKLDEKLQLHYAEDGNISTIAASFSVVKKGADGSPDSQQKPKDTIFEAINQVLKFIEYDISEKLKEYDVHADEIAYQVLIDCYYPIIVFDGDLYSGQLDLDDDKIEIKEEKHVVLRYHYQPKYAAKPSGFFIDVVRKDYFKEFIETVIEPERVKLTSLAEQYNKQILVDAHKLVNDTESSRTLRRRGFVSSNK